MAYRRLCEGDYRIMRVIWENEPINSTALVKLCEAQLGWKKSTTYTMLRKMCEKGFAKNENSIVTSLVSHEWVRANESEFIVDQAFEGSLPRFLVAFLGEKKISAEEAEELKKLIDSHMD